MEFFDLVKNRYSCKKFDGRQVDAAQLKAILEAGRLAPTAKNLQEQKIYVVQSAQGLAKIDAVTPCRYGAPTVLIVALDKNNVFVYPGGKRDSGVEDAAIVATHMMLTAWEAGIGSCWVGYFPPSKLAGVLGLAQNHKPVLLMPMGYPAEDAAPSPLHEKTRSLDELVTTL